MANIFKGKGLPELPEEDDMIEDREQFPQKTIEMKQKLHPSNVSHTIFTTNQQKNPSVDVLGFTRINEQKGLSLFGDKDKDKVMNIFDNKPRKKNSQGVIHNFFGNNNKKVNGLMGINTGKKNVNYNCLQKKLIKQTKQKTKRFKMGKI